jgi:hypothetical protein
MVTTVNKTPSRPASITLPKFIPKPSPTTEICSRSFVTLLIFAGNGLPITSAAKMPNPNANGGAINGSKHKKASKTKIASRQVIFGSWFIHQTSEPPAVAGGSCVRHPPATAGGSDVSDLSLSIRFSTCLSIAGKAISGVEKGTSATCQNSTRSTQSGKFRTTIGRCSSS